MEIDNSIIKTKQLLEWTVEITKAKLEEDKGNSPYTNTAEETAAFMKKIHETLVELAKKDL